MFLSASAGLVTVLSLVRGPYASAKRVTSMPLVLSLDPATTSTIEHACGDCHSNNTRWPSYSLVAPVSWLIRQDVSQGRKFLNFSLFSEYPATGQSQLLALAADQVRNGEMPPRRYLLLHSDARLSDQTRSRLMIALQQESARLSK